jgi:hypothetical protein
MAEESKTPRPSKSVVGGLKSVRTGSELARRAAVRAAARRATGKYVQTRGYPPNTHVA